MYLLHGEDQCPMAESTPVKMADSLVVVTHKNEARHLDCDL